MENKKTTTKITEEFNWNALTSFRDRKKSPNPEIFEKHGVKIYNNEPYALDFFEAVFLGREIESKEPKINEARRIVSVNSVSDTTILVSLTGYIDAIIDVKNEKHFCSLHNLTTQEFVDWLNTETGVESFLDHGYQVVIESINPYVKVSLSKGQTIKIKSEFFDQIKKPTSAYVGKIMEKNGGGFIIKVQGVDGFLPGSLAATNIVRDFDAMIGKEIPVVVEDYLKESSTFVFSFKKYVSMILPTKMAELSMEDKYTGAVTGVAKYGVFVEFEDIFTGLIHTSKMTPEYKERFNTGGFKPGMPVDFWIKEITNDKKIILTDEDPSIRRAEIEDFKDKNLGTTKNGEVIAIQPFGTLVKLQKDIVGLISQKEIKSKKKVFNVGDNVLVSIDRVHNDKIYLTLPNEG